MVLCRCPIREPNGKGSYHVSYPEIGVNSQGQEETKASINPFDLPTDTTSPIYKLVDSTELLLSRLQKSLQTNAKGLSRGSSLATGVKELDQAF